MHRGRNRNARWLAPACAAAFLAFVATGNAGNMDSSWHLAWAENVGWINMAPSGGGVMLHFNGTSGYLSGLAWGENIGWIKWGADAGGPYENTGTGNWGVNVDAGGVLRGYAWGENIGWLKLDSDTGQVLLDWTTGEFTGEAWGENIGWVRFQGDGDNYGVRTIAFDRQARGTPNWWLDLYGVNEDFDEGDGIPAWQEQVADTDPRDPESFLAVVKVLQKPWGRLFYFPSSPARCYTLQSCEVPGSGIWSNVPGQVSIQGEGGMDLLMDASSPPTAFHRLVVGENP